MNAEKKYKRKLTGFILKPVAQAKIGLYSIFLSILLIVSLSWIVYSNFAELVDSIILLTDAPEEVKAIFSDYWKYTRVWIYSVLAIYLAAMVGVSWWYTHRFLGPSIAFQKHLEEIAKGNYKYRTSLRKGDELESVANALNRVSEVLEHDHYKH